MPDDELAIDSGALIFATLADVYLSSGMVDEAISILKDGLSRNPTYTLAKIILGRAYYMKGDIEEAIKVLEDTYKEAQDSENANLYLGHCYRKLGEYEKAIKYYEVTLKINPAHKEAKREIETLRPEPVPPPVEEKVEKAPEPAKVEEKVEKVVEKPAEPTPPPVKEKVEKVAEPVPPPVEEKVEKAPEPVKVEEKVEKVVEKVAEPAPPPVEEKVEKAPEPVKVEEKVEKVVEKPAEPVTVPLVSLDKPVKRLLRNKTVKGVFICSKDGLLIQNYFKDRADIEEICAMIAAIYNEAEESFKFLKEGSVEKFIIEKEDETISVITAGESLLTVVTQPETKPGLVFVYSRKIINEIREILG